MIKGRVTYFFLLLLASVLSIGNAQAGVDAPKDYEEVVIEQALQVAVDKEQVFIRLAELDNYAYFYPLFSSLTINPHNQTGERDNLVDFTASSTQQFGPIFIERQYYGMLAVDEAKSRIQLHLVDEDGVLINLDMHIVAKNGHTAIFLKTSIKAPKQDVADLLVDELRAPTLRLEALKVLLENEDLPAAYACQYSAKTNHYCF